MPIEIDWEWLNEQALDDQSLLWLSRIRQWRSEVLNNNELTKSNRLFSVNLGNHEIWFRESGAFASIETYCEIFRENNHFLVPEFSSKDARTIVDIGANEGFYALRVKAENPACRVLCYEPNPYAYELLKKNFTSNGLEGVSATNKAVGPVAGKVSLDIIKEISSIGGKGLRSVKRAWLKDEFVETIEAQTCTLEDLCREHSVREIDILKIDVEGMEMEILKNSTGLLKNVRRIVVERHSRELRDQLKKLLIANGFSLLYEEDPECNRYYGDLYFANNFFA